MKDGLGVCQALLAWVEGSEAQEFSIRGGDPHWISGFAFGLNLQCHELAYPGVRPTIKLTPLARSGSLRLI